jgi:hypothetical protein
MMYKIFRAKFKIETEIDIELRDGEPIEEAILTASELAFYTEVEGDSWKYVSHEIIEVEE